MLTKKTILVVLFACGPATPADGVRARGGVDPIICYRTTANLNACRDGVGTFWVCDSRSPVECMRAEEPAKVFALPEHPARDP